MRMILLFMYVFILLFSRSRTSKFLKFLVLSMTSPINFLTSLGIRDGDNPFELT